MRAVAEIEESGGHPDRGDRIPVPNIGRSGREKDRRSRPCEDLDGISRTQNDSAGRQARLVIELKRDANANVVLNNLYKHTPMQTSFGSTWWPSSTVSPDTGSGPVHLALRGPSDRSSPGGPNTGWGKP